MEQPTPTQTTTAMLVAETTTPAKPVTETTIPAKPATGTIQEQLPDPKRPKVLSVSQPEQPKLSKPRILAQLQSTSQPEIPASQPRLQLSSQSTTQSAPAQPVAPRNLADPKTEADWAEQTLSQAEKDAEEQRMANDVTQPFTTTSTSLTKQEEKQTAAVQAPKTEPKSVPGLLYAIKGLASSISRKITGK